MIESNIRQYIKSERERLEKHLVKLDKLEAFLDSEDFPRYAEEAMEPPPPLATQPIPKDPVTLPGGRTLDYSKVPPSLAEKAQKSANLCPTCGMPKNGATCIECSVTPAGQ